MRHPLLSILLTVLIGGCAAQPWASSFTPTDASAPERRADAPVVRREVPWERLQQTLNELLQERIASDIHPDEWPAERKAAAKARLLKGLQVSEDSALVTVLGRSEFRSTSEVRTDDGGLDSFARRIGATMVVWSRTYLGRRQVTTHEPANEYTTVSRPFRDKRGHWRYDSYTEHSTIWVPVQVEADEHAWMAYFLRENEAVMRDASASISEISRPAN